MKRLALILALLSLPAAAATATFAAGTASTSNGTSYNSGAFTPAANDLLVVFVAVTGKTAMSGANACTDNLGGTYVQHAIALKATSADTAYVFVAQQLAAASSTTITCTTSASNATGGSVFVWRVSGVTRLGTLAIRQHAEKNNSASGTPAVSFPVAALTGNPTLGFIFNATSPAGMTAPTNWTEPTSPSGDLGYSTPTTGAETVGRDSGFTGTTITWGNSSASAYAAMIIEIDTSSQDGDYSTIFNATETPLSEGSTWYQGTPDGGDWLNMNETPGTTFASNITSGTFNDATALRKGTWVDDQKVCAVVTYPNSVAGIPAQPKSPELEIRLNSAMSTSPSHSNTGYEYDLSVDTITADTPYQSWVRWNGPLGNFTYIGKVGANSCNTTSGFPLYAGDVVCAYRVSGVYHATVNGLEPQYTSGCVFTGFGTGGTAYTATDSTYTGGQPGLGALCDGCSAGENTRFGWSAAVFYGASAPSGVRKRVVVTRR